MLHVRIIPYTYPIQETVTKMKEIDGMFTTSHSATAYYMNIRLKSISLALSYLAHKVILLFKALQNSVQTE